jgi:phage host-nuclease inhibitor protein Gam
MSREKISDWADADHVLAELGELNRDLTRLETERNEAIAAAKIRFFDKGTPVTDRITALEAALRRYVLEHEEELDLRSRTLTNGRVGLHLAHALTVRSIKKAVAWLVAAKKWAFLRVKHELNKEALADAPADVLKACGAKVKSYDVCFYEVDGVRYQIEE